MPAILHIVETPDETAPWTLRDDPGAMWRFPDFDAEGREAWVIVLPNRVGIWWTTYIPDDGSGKMWEVTGTPPNITVNPSIDAGDWHGFIKDGVMTP